MKFSKILIAILLVGFVSGCHVFLPTPQNTETASTDTPSAAQSSIDGLSLDTFKNLSFHAPALEKEVPLINGKYEAGSGETYESLQLLDTAGFGDLNGDGKVNLIDFSILLFYWGSDNACADQNSNGKVDLVDFSILLYNWTG